MLQSIDASPTLLVNNRPFERKITKANLMRFECSSGSVTDSTACADLPECGEDIDCRKTGFHGTCTPEGKCTFEKAASFTFTIVTADSMMQHPETGARKTTEELFPGAGIVTYTLSSPEGRELVGKLHPDALPLYLFDTTVASDINFSRIREGIVRKGPYYTFRQGVVPVNYLHNRKKTPGTLVLFCDPFFRGVSDILSTVLSDTLYRERIIIQPLIFAEPKSAVPGTEEFLRQEEALRWLLLGKKGPEIIRAYLDAYGKYPGSSWWTRLLDGCGISPDSLAAAAAVNEDFLETFWQMLEILQVRDPVLLLKDNVEIITIGGKREFEQLLLRCSNK